MVLQLLEDHDHKGLERTRRSWCYWPGMSAEVAHWCQAWEHCQVAKNTQPVAQSYMGQLLSFCPNENFAIDYTLLDSSHNGLEKELLQWPVSL